MIIEQHHRDKAAAMTQAADWGKERSPEWHAGLLQAVAYNLADRPHGHGRSACPYEPKTAQRDAWIDGFTVGHVACMRENIDAALAARGH